MDVSLIFPHQLFADHPAICKSRTVYLVEELLFFKLYPFHKQKIAFHRASMKAYESNLREKGYQVEYIDAISVIADIRQLIPELVNKGVKTIFTIDPSDYWLEKRLKEGCIAHQIKLQLAENSIFINTKEDLTHFFKADKKSFFQTTFYKQQRKKHSLLLDEKGAPQGGSWTYDQDNRKKYPKGKTPPPIHYPDQNEHYQEAVEYVKKHFVHHYGSITEQPLYPIDHAGAETWLSDFFEYRFHEFGAYEDAIVKDETILNHSVLTPMMNVGLLEPKTIVEKAITYSKENDVPIQSTEGFVRQIIGWREFMRGMYHIKHIEHRTTNFWDFQNSMPQSFYTAETGILPIDETIKKVLKDGYCHHIERLMVLGNFMLLCEIHPDAVYQWFMELFIDAYDWVMVPNVYGMSQFADGGLFATKPYISGSNYIMKMSNYPKGDWQEVWDALFWRFMHRQRTFFESNPRLGMLVRNLDRMDNNKLSHHLAVGDEFLKKIHG